MQESFDHTFAVMAYHDSPYLVQCLDSLQNQTVRSKIYIATSTPSDFIRETSKKYGIDLLVTASGNGIAHDWNFSLHQAQTKYVTLAHQDDLYLPDYTKLCLEVARQYDDMLIGFTGYKEIAGTFERSNTLLLRVKRSMLWCFMPFSKNIRSRFLKKKLLSLGCPISAPSVMYNLEGLSGFEFSSVFSINVDWDAWGRMAEMKGRFIYISQILLKHRIHPESATTAGLKANKRQQEDLVMFRRFWPGRLALFFSKVYAAGYKSNEPI